MQRIYQPELGQNIQQGFASLGSLFAPPTAQELVAKQTIAGQQATQAAQAASRTRIGAGQGSPADFATLGVSDPTKNYVMGKLYADSQAHPDAAPSTYDSGVYIMGGDAAKTFAGQQAAPLNENQSRILPPALAGALGVPTLQHGVVGLGTDDKMLPGSGTQPIASAPTDENAAPDTTDALAARVGWDAYRRAQGGGGQGGSASSLPLFASGSSAPADKSASSPQQDPLMSALFGASMSRLGKGSAPQNQTTIDMKGETAEASESGKMAAQRADTLYQMADKAPEEIARLKLLGNVLQRTKTGPLAGATGTAVAVANSLGVPPDRLAALGIDPNQAVNNETAQKLANEMVAGSIGAKGGGFPASNFSVAERQFIEKMFPSISSQPGSNEFVSDVLQARGQRTLQKAQDFTAYRRQQQQAGKPISFNDFDSAWQQEHANENVFAPIIDKFNSGGYAPAGAAPPAPGGQVGTLAPTQPSSVAAGPGGGFGGTGAAPISAQATAPQMPTLTDPSQVARLPSGTRFKTPDGRIGVAP